MTMELKFIIGKFVNDFAAYFLARCAFLALRVSQTCSSLSGLRALDHLLPPMATQVRTKWAAEPVNYLLFLP